MKFKKQKRLEFVFLIVVGLLTIFLAFLPTGFENPSLTNSSLYEKGRVVTVDNNELSTFSLITTGTQSLQIAIKSGKFKGDTLTANNLLLGQKRLDKLFVIGDKVHTIIQLDPTNKNKILGVRAADYYRQDMEYILFICFALFLILFCKLVGFKAIISFIFTAFAFWKLLIPAFLRGYSPLTVSLGVVFLTSTIIILLVAGLNKKGLVALLGTIAGITITALLALGFGFLFNIPGVIQEYSEALLYAGFAHLHLSEIFISVIFISAAGAVMDVSMDISAALNELIIRTPSLTRKDLMLSGFRIAAPIIGSMTTTLLFAYSGSFMFAFMAFMAKGTSYQSILNTNYISAEILHTLVGSFGLVLVAPFTVIIGAFLYSQKKQ